MAIQASLLQQPIERQQKAALNPGISRQKPVAETPFRDWVAMAQSQTVGSNSAKQVSVQKGDTLSGMIRRFVAETKPQVSSSELNRLLGTVSKSNGISDPNRIFVGQKIDFSSIGGKEIQKEAESSVKASQPEQIVKDYLAEPTVQLKYDRTVIVGDSIAVGIGASILRKKGVQPQLSVGSKNLSQNEIELSVDATVGLSSGQILQKIKQNNNVRNSQVAVISAGTNDLANAANRTPEKLNAISQNLRNIRSSLNATQNVWILPYDTKGRELVSSIAKEYGDGMVDLGQFASADNYHPKNYAEIAHALKLPEVSVSKIWVSTLSMLQSRAQTP